uniref:Protein SRG1 n=1 Tax=Aegilops tauschii TaxID=37682 RepID=N1QTW6_AEGTA
MSDDSRTVPQEQLPSDDLHPPPMPVINLGHLNLDPAIRACVVEDITKACRDLGYFQLKNHCKRVTTGKLGAMTTFEIPRLAVIASEYMGNFATELRRVALQLMEAILEGLGLGKDYQHEKFEQGLQLMSVNCYPKESEGDTAIGLAPHSDYGFLTILFTSCRGLEVVDRNSNSWKVVQPLPHALHVHVGDHMEVLSNGRIKTVVHRAVLNPEEARISMASINGFAMHEKVSSARELVNEQNPEKYTASSFNDFLNYLTSNLDNKHRNFLESLRNQISKAKVELRLLHGNEIEMEEEPTLAAAGHGSPNNCHRCRNECQCVTLIAALLKAVSILKM